MSCSRCLPAAAARTEDSSRPCPAFSGLALSATRPGHSTLRGVLGNQGADVRDNSDSLPAGLADDSSFERSGGGGGWSGADGLPVSGPSTLWCSGCRWPEWRAGVDDRERPSCYSFVAVVLL